MFTPRMIHEQPTEKDAVKVNCALVLDPSHVLLGAEDGLMIYDFEEVPLKLGEKKITYLERCDSMIVYMGMICCHLLFCFCTSLVCTGQRNRCPCLIHAGLLLGPLKDLDASSVKMADARSCQLIAMGMAGNVLCLCTTNRKKASVYELNPKKMQYSKLKVI